MNNVFEIGMKIEIYENRLLFIKKDLQKELSKHEINWEQVHKLSTKAVDYNEKIKEHFNLKLKCIHESV